MLKFFHKKSCPRCPSAKKAVEKLVRAGHEVERYSQDDAIGLAESAFYSIKTVPALLLLKNDVIMQLWVDKMPTADEIE